MSWDPVAVVALILVVLTLAVPAVLVGVWALARSRGSVSSRRARVILIVALGETVLLAMLWTVYFVWLAPVLTSPAG